MREIQTLLLSGYAVHGKLDAIKEMANHCEEISSNLNKTLVEETFGNEGYCLPGSISCNGTCTIDSRIPLKVSI